MYLAEGKELFKQNVTNLFFFSNQIRYLIRFYLFKSKISCKFNAKEIYSQY